MTTKEKTKNKKQNFIISESTYNTFKKKISEADISTREAVAIMIKNFNKTGKLSISQNNDNYVSDEEQAEIENDKELIASIKRAEKDVKEGRTFRVNG